MNNCNTNFLSPTGFILTLPGFKEVSFQCTSVNLPGISMGSPNQGTPFNDISLVGDKLQYEDLEVTFLVDEDCVNYSLIHNWMVGITYPQKSTQWRDFVEHMKEKDFQNEGNYEQIDVYLSILNSNYNTTFKIVYTDAFPVALSPLEFTTEASDIQYLSATARFRYTYFKITDRSNNQKTL